MMYGVGKSLTAKGFVLYIKNTYNSKRQVTQLKIGQLIWIDISPKKKEDTPVASKQQEKMLKTLVIREMQIKYTEREHTH